MEIILYGRNNNCSRCEQAKTYLKNLNVEYKFIDIDKDESALALLRELKFRQIPVLLYNKAYYTLEDLKEIKFKN